MTATRLSTQVAGTQLGAASRLDARGLNGYRTEII
jgi:hypothetical protein